MVKDRLNELKHNNTHDNTESGTQKLRHTFQRADAIAQWIVQIENNNQDIRIHLRKIEDMKSNQKAVEEKLRSLFQNNTTIAQQISPKLKEVETELQQIGTESTEKRIKTIQYTTSKKRFEKAFIENNQLLENYKSIQKQVIKSQLVAKGYFQVTDEEVTSLLEDGTDIQIFTENILAETAEAKRVLADVEERHQQLLHIERMLVEVRDLFVQMSILIDSQQELVDRIEFQAQSATEYVGAGAVDLNSARDKKKKSFRTKIYILVALVVIILIILIILLK
ncbi:syntaxin-1A-like isoform X2 [Zophobas morio]|uniref:syntaxin-1A-like isoform X2 n=1 Tax=Zophobas morio TaxID=2755281 RepID=UPI003082E810